uniref:Uncharacterized protein n=1 Tax=Romanomermis culicivorax TaxID=13658 RepID=A0A915HZF8_ROMCU
MIPIDLALWVNRAHVGPTVYGIERAIKPKLLQSDMAIKPKLLQDLPKELVEESRTYREAGDKILNYCAPDCNLDMLKQDLMDIKQELDEAATKFLKRVSKGAYKIVEGVEIVEEVLEELILEEVLEISE